MLGSARTRARAVIIAAALFGAGSAAAPAEAQLKPLKIVQLGDSYSAGNGARNYWGPKDCYRSSRNWAEKYVDTLRATHHVTFINRACSGGVLSQFTSRRDMGSNTYAVYVPGSVSKDSDAARRKLDEYGTCKTDFPGDETFEIEAQSAHFDSMSGMTIVYFKCTRYMEPQWEAVGKDTDLVLFSIGGNDVHFSDIVKQCFAVGLRDADTCREKIDKAKVDIVGVGDRIETFLRDLKRERMRPDAKIVIKAYPYLEKDENLELQKWFGLGGSYAVGREIRALGDMGDEAQRKAVEAVNAEGGAQVHFLDTVKPHFAGHEPDGRVCCRNDDRWLNEFETRIMMEWYHYNPTGHTEIARLLSHHGDFGAGSATGNGGSVDITFVIDTTGSMGSAINSVKSAATQLVNSVSSRTQSARFALVDYRDFASRTGASYDYPAKLDQDFTSSASTINTAIQGLTLGYGGDWPETMYSGLWKSFDLGWRPGVKKMAIVLADAPPLSPEPFTGLTGTDIIARSLSIDPVEVHYVDISGYTSWADPEAATIAARTNGGIYRTSPSLAAAEIADVIDGSLDAPYAWAAGPYVGTIGQTFTLDGSGSYGHGSEIVKYEWDVNSDGVYDKVVTTPTTTHAYGAAFDGLITLRVTDAAGRTALATTIVDVSADGDQQPDHVDNCDDVENHGQEDYDGDGAGDACDDTPGWPTEDKEGVNDSGSSGGGGAPDPDGDSRPASITQFRTPHFNLAGRIESAQDPADYFGVQHAGGRLQAQLVGLTKDYDLVLTDASGTVLHRSSADGLRSESIRETLAAGRYLVGVIPKAGQFDADRSYRVNVTPLG